MNSGSTCSEVCHSKGIHVTDQLSMREVQTCLTVADGVSIRHHCETSRRSIRKFKIHHLRGKLYQLMTYKLTKFIDLLVADIILALVDTFTIRSISQGVHNIFDIGYTIGDRACRPSCVTMYDRIKIDCQKQVSVPTKWLKTEREIYFILFFAL